MKIFAKLLFVFYLFVFSVPAVAGAANIHIGEDYFLKGAEVVANDLYVVGPTATLAGKVLGDAVALGRTIWSESAISQDALFFGERIHLLGVVSDDARLLGGVVRVGGEVKDDAVFIGGEVTIEPEASINGNLYILSGETRLQGAVRGNAKIIAKEARISGSIAGELEIWGNVFLEPGATVGGDLIYHARQEIPALGSAPIGGRIIFDQTETRNGAGMFRFSGFFSGAFSLLLLMSLALGFFLFFFARPRMEEILYDTLFNFWPRMLRGVLIAILLPLLAFLFGVSIVGLPLGILLLLLFLSAGILSVALAPIMVGAWIEKIFFKRSPFPLLYRPVLLGNVALSFLFVIPYIGALMSAGLILVALGGIGTAFYRHLRQSM